ncbi:LemA family protein [Ferruginibacter sp. SUN106]|uniref:LemA family protein n=1 Tax=Ferruginibacter sp. SUN106 TaxID=2978348 RepID=UPI003D36F404
MANNPGKKFWLTAVIIIALLAIFFFTSYNSMVKKQEQVTKTWNNVQSDYQRRLDLVPNLVSTVKASSDYENQTLLKLVEARAKAAQLNITGDASYENYKKTEAANAELVASANKVIAVIEKYPDLKTTTSFVRLQDQLEGTERRIKFSRNDFNQAVMEYNKTVRSFPSSIAASVFGFKVKEGFQADMGTEKAPEIIFTK